MIDAVCDICGRQTAEPHEIKIHKLYDDEPIFVRVICDKCAKGITKDIRFREEILSELHKAEEKDI